MFDPMYDCYGSMAKRAGGLVKAVKLKTQDWSVDRDELQQAFTAKTKLIVVNTPHNPTGKIFSKHDLQFIADLCIQHNTYALLDEVHSPRCCISCLHELCCMSGPSRNADQSGVCPFANRCMSIWCSRALSILVCAALRVCGSVASE